MDKEKTLPRIAVIDGQGGGIGSTIIRKINESYRDRCEIWALGTNAIATAQMMKAGANRGATGEPAITHSAGQVQIVIGPISIVIPYAMMGEVTPAMVEAIGHCRAHKFLIPLTQEPVTVIGAVQEPLPHLVDELISVHLKPLLAPAKGGVPCR